MKNQENSYLDQFEDDGEAEDTLSFCNLPIENGNDISPQESPRHSSYQDELFEFSNGSLNHENCPTTTPYNLFGGKIIHQDEDEAMIRPPSSRNPSYDYGEHRIAKNRSVSSRVDSYYNSKHPDFKYSVSDVQNVSITALTSMSAKSRRRMFIFGPAKYMPEMELSAIKQRQGKLAPKPILSQIVSGGGKPIKSSPSSRWRVLLRSLRSRSHINAIFSRSFGCIPVVGVEKWISD